uniref:REC114 meiotic recombination protein n=1 Tax=Aquila chrysaetos chrysaetos TaxID=223781 RepID=A0A663DWD1_AQUCH
MAVAGGGRSSDPGKASVPGGTGDTSLLGSATTWPLKRYGRFLPPTDGSVLTGIDFCFFSIVLKVFESNEESGHLILTIVVSGHFFISQGRTVLNECRMFRVQFGGDSKEQMLEHCCSCVQKLAEYVPVQVTDEQSQKLYHSLNQLANSENQAKDTEQNASVLHTVSKKTLMLLHCYKNTVTLPFMSRTSSVLKKKSELPLVYQHSAWRAQELRPFIRLCLMDQNFPAFVEDVEKELKKLVEG